MAITRRSFVQGAALSGAAALAAGGSRVAFANESREKADYPWPAEAPVITEDMVESEANADVIIIGLGLAGVAAARAAAEEGASVLGIEKSETPNVRSGDFAVVGGETMARWGLDSVVTPDVAANHEMDECSYFPKRSIWLKWARNCGTIFDWYVTAYPELYVCENSICDVPDGVGTYMYPYFCPLPEGYDYTQEEHPCFPSSVTFSPSQSAVFNANWETAQSMGAQALFGHFGEVLITDDNGRVIGVYARNAATGKYVKAMANKSVVLTTGDYSSNDEMLDYFCPWVHQNGITNWWPDRDVESNPVNVGDGLRMGDWIGAAIDKHHAPMIHWMGKVLGGTGMDMSPVGTAPFCYLNKKGKRFMNEDVPGQQMENQIELQPAGVCYQIWDSNWADQWDAFPIKHGKATYCMDECPQNRGTDPTNPSDVITPEAVEAAVEIGRVYKADTIEGLLNQLSAVEEMDVAEGLKSIERYNELATAGCDDDFGKIASRLFPIQDGPFYGTVCGLGDMLVSMGGLESDEECHVYNTDGDIIDGIYVAGNIQGSRFAVQYPIAFKGVSHSMALYYGYVAGKNAVAQA